MGQTTAAVLLGIQLDKKMYARLYSKDDDGEPVWAELPYRKQPEEGEFFDVLGFSVVVSNGNEPEYGDGEITKGVALDGFAEAYKKDVARARKRWDAFAAWMKERGHDLPEPTLLLTIVERA